MGLLDGNRFLFRGNVGNATETYSLATAQSNLKDISPKSGYGCIAITVLLSAPGSKLYLRKKNQNNSYIIVPLIDEYGELHYMMDYYNNQSYLNGHQGKTYYIPSDEITTYYLMNYAAVLGENALVKVDYLKRMPDGIESLKPRQIIYRNLKTFTEGATSNNLTVPEDAYNEISCLMKYFKYMAVEIAFYDSSNARKNVSFSFKLFGRIYAPANTHTISGMIGNDVLMYEADVTNKSSLVSDMFEVKGTDIRFQTTLSSGASAGDMMVLQIIGIR